MDLNTALSIIGTVLGVFGLGWFWAGLYGLIFHRHPVRGVLRLSRSAPVDIVAPSNAIVPGDRHEAATHMTSVGDVRAVAAASRFLSVFYRGKPARIHIGVSPARPAGDRLLIGSDFRNPASNDFIHAFNEIFDADIVIDTELRLVTVAGRRIEDFDHQWEYSPAYRGDLPRRDLALVVIAPWALGDDRRVIMCAGLTTYGTEGAASFLFDEIWKSRQGKELRSALRRSEAAVIAIYVGVESGEAVRTSVLGYITWDSTRRIHEKFSSSHRGVAFPEPETSAVLERE